MKTVATNTLILLVALCASGLCLAQEQASQAYSNRIPAKLTLIVGSLDGAGGNDGPVLQAHFGHASLQGRTVPKGIAVDSKGDIFVAEPASHVIRKITPGGIVVTVAGKSGEPGRADGAGDNARFYGPVGLAIDKQDNLYVADTGNAAIRKILPDGSVHTLVSGKVGNVEQGGMLASLVQPMGVAVDGNTGDIYIADNGNSSIQRISPDGKIANFAGDAHSAAGFENGKGITARFSRPTSIAWSPDGSIYVADEGNDAIRKISPDGQVSTPVCSYQMDKRVCKNQIFDIGDALAVLALEKNVVYLATGDGIAKFDETTGLLKTISGRKALDAEQPTQEEMLGAAGAGALAPDGTGGIYFIGDTIVGRIAPTGQLSLVAGSYEQGGSQNGKTADATFNRLAALAADGKGNLYVSDQGNGLIRKIDLTGLVTTLAGTLRKYSAHSARQADPMFDAVSGLAVDGVGNLYFTDLRNKTVGRVSAAGTVAILAGAPGQDPQKDGSASKARFSYPQSLTYGEPDVLYISDDNALRLIDLTKSDSAEKYVMTIDIKNRPHPITTAESSYIAEVFHSKTRGLIVNDSGHLISVAPDGSSVAIGGNFMVDRQIDGTRVILRTGDFAIDEHDRIFFLIGNKLRFMDFSGKILGEVDARGEKGTSLESLDEIESPSNIVYLGHNAFAFLSRNAILKITLE